MTTSTVSPEIAEFAQRVRTALADLPADEIDDLTDGLEADLSESLAEDLARTLPDPVAYAAELRAAAGLPVRARNRGVFSGLGKGWHDTRVDLGIAIQRNPVLAGALDFLIELRPAWWLVRAWVAFQTVVAFFGAVGSWLPAGVLQWLVLAAFTVVSVQWGRRRWLPRSGLPLLIGAGNVLAVLLLIPMVSHVEHGSQLSAQPMYVGDGIIDDQPQSGITLDGEPVTNIFAYGADGNPLTNVQLFDVDGRPLEPSRNEDDQTRATPATLETGAEAYNVFPLMIIRLVYDQSGTLVPDPSSEAGKSAVYPNGPFLKVPAVQAPEKAGKSTQ